MYERVKHKKHPPKVFYEKAVLTNLAIFTGNTCLCWSVFLLKLQAGRSEKTLQHRSFPMNITKFSRATILKNI